MHNIVKDAAETGLSRRDLLQHSLLAVPLCCQTPAAPDASYRFEENALHIDLAGTPSLRRPGGAVAVVDTERKMNLLVIHHREGEYAAIDRTCTHGGAMCAYNARRRTVRCTSLNHAEYDLSGALLHGRKHGNLRAYAVERRGSALVIRWETQS